MQTAVAPGATLAGQVMPDGISGSVTVSAFSVVLPVLVKANSYCSTTPALLNDVGDAAASRLSNVNEGVRVAATVSVSVAVGLVMPAAVTTALAVFTIWPASIFACVTV